MDYRFLDASRMRTLVMLAGVSLLPWPLPPAAAWDEWHRADQAAGARAAPGPRRWGADQDSGNSLWDNLIGGAVVPGVLSWRGEPLAPSPSPEPPQPAPTTATPTDHSALACNFSDWQPVASPWPDRLQQLTWDRVDVVPPGQAAPPPKPFRPSQPLVERPAPAPVRTPAPPCYSSIQLPRTTSASRSSTATYQLLYSPDTLPSTAWDANTETSRCLWTLVAPPGYNLSATVSMGSWGSGRGALHLYAQTADGELQPVFSLRAPAQSSAEVHTHSGVAVLATALPASATFTLRVRVAASSAAASAELADSLQPPPGPAAGQQRPWADSWESGLSPPPASKPSSTPSWRPKPYPYPASNVDVEAVDLTHPHQAANCEVEQQQQQHHHQQQQRPPETESTAASTPPPKDEQSPPNTTAARPAEKPGPERPAAAGSDKPSTSTAKPPEPTSPPPPGPPAVSTPAASTITAATTSRGPPPAKGTAGSATTAKPTPGASASASTSGPGQSSVNNKKP
ncbi:hypothetical protein KUF71_015742 [Frankliniella fusca]|uniref:CUB domain-containing protein n=1 Tax=Frankliniella fusca TaxID=407009 RepID=A0AAE1LR90_9NEOP|nr:hypothetical protein KUF71_015742 [Frankliniella fusca]